jgi:glycosyltransferase involved in cell wall biosynthesis
MRILHITSSFAGGAGIAVRRIVEAQRQTGIKSDLYARSGASVGLESHERPLKFSELGGLASKCLTAFQSIAIQKSDLLTTPLSLSLTSQIKELAINYDLIHVHAMYNTISHKAISIISRDLPVVVTLHDERFFTGGCHYSFDCSGFQQDCHDCPQLRGGHRSLSKRALLLQKDAISEIEDISFVSPTEWLAKRAQSSSILSSKRVEIIPNPIPKELYLGAHKTRCFSSDQLRLGFISQNLNNPYKGLDVLLRAISLLPDKRRVRLILFGHGQVNPRSHGVETEQFVFRNDLERQEAIQSLDVVVVPSIQDNLPSSLTESLACGIPVIASRAGGIEEIIDRFHLPSFETGNARELAKALMRADELLLPSSTIKRIREFFSYELSAKRHLALYDEILSAKRR